jgi:hypothetical protein
MNRATSQKLCHTTFHHRALGRGEGLQYILTGTCEGPLITRLFLAFERSLRFGRSIPGVDRHCRLFVGKENPVAVLLRKIAPWLIDVVAECDQDISQVLPLPGTRPRGDGPLPDGKLVIRYQRALTDLMDAADAVAFWAGPSGVFGENDSA